MSNKDRTSTRLAIFSGQLFAVAVLFAIAAVGTAFADTISKPFGFGGALEYSRSHFRTFNIPCQVGVLAEVKFKRIGPNGVNNDIPIIIELRAPDTAANQEGPTADTESAIAKESEQTVTLNGFGTNRGCSLPWRVRVRSLNEGTVTSAVIGTINFNFAGGFNNVDVGSDVGELKKGDSVTKNLGSLVAAFSTGTFGITGRWGHRIYGVPGPSAVKLRFALIDPSGEVVKTAEGYSSDEARSELPKLQLIYKVVNCTPGQWKLKITNIDDDDDAGGIGPSARFTPGCP